MRKRRMQECFTLPGAVTARGRVGAARRLHPRLARLPLAVVAALACLGSFDGADVAYGSGHPSQAEAGVSTMQSAASVPAVVAPRPVGEPAESMAGITLLDLITPESDERSDTSALWPLPKHPLVDENWNEPLAVDTFVHLGELCLQQAHYYAQRVRQIEERLALARRRGNPMATAGLAAERDNLIARWQDWTLTALKRHVELSIIPRYQDYSGMDAVLAKIAALLTVCDKPGQNQHFKHGQIQRYWGMLLRKYPQSPYVGLGHLALGDSYFANGDYPRAIQFYQSALRVGEGRFARYALYRIGKVYFALGEYPRALAAFAGVLATAEAR